MRKAGLGGLAAWVVLGTTWFASAGESQTPLPLSREGKSDYLIVLPDNPTAVEKTAALELQIHLAEMTGARLPIFPESQGEIGRPRIFVGDCAHVRRLVPEAMPARLGPDAIVIKTLGRDLVLTGHARRGSLYAVFSFLEEDLGVRWWTPTEATIPKRPSLVVAPVDRMYAPKVIDRAVRYLAATSDGVAFSHKHLRPEEQRRMGVFAARLRLNGEDMYTIPEEYGGRNRLLGWVHTFSETNFPGIQPLLPPDLYFDQHPDWYALVDGKRQKHGAQLCLTNEPMRKELIRRALERLKAHPDATIISISQNDNNRRCQCEKCRAVEEEEGAPSGLLIRFVNAVAEEIEKHFPDVLVETLAYQYTRQPPRKVRPRRNVIIRLCTIECSFSQTLESGPSNEPFRRDLEVWSQIASQLYIWDYVTNFSAYLIPHPNWHVLAPNIRYLVRHKAVGIFEQGDSGSRIGELVRLRAWLLAHLLWNPDADEQKLLREFMEGYYGPAAPSLIDYIHLMSRAVQRSKARLGCFTPDTKSWLTLDDLNQATRLFDQALAAVKEQPMLSERVRRERLPVDLVWLQRYEEFHQQALKEGKEFLGPSDPAQACLEYIALARKHQVGEYRQGHPFSQYEPTLRKLLLKD